MSPPLLSVHRNFRRSVHRTKGETFDFRFEPTTETFGFRVVYIEGYGKPTTLVATLAYSTMVKHPGRSNTSSSRCGVKP